MPYPLISEYVEVIKSAEDNFEELSYLRPVLVDDVLPVMTSGNFAVVFKMKDERDGKFYAVKCFTKEQKGRVEAYREIAKELKDISSPYLVSIRYLENELFVDTNQTTKTEFPVLLMDWVEGKTLDKYLRENLDDKYALEMLAYRFSQLAHWLIPQPFAHGDLKPDNILVREDGSLVLVDYDGMYVPAMKGQKARELGSPDFRHPLRTEAIFDEHIDDFPLVSILLSLKAISLDSSLLEEYGAIDRLLFSAEDYLQMSNNNIIHKLLSCNNPKVNHVTCVFLSLLNHSFAFSIPVFDKPYNRSIIGNVWINDAEKLNKMTIDNLASAPPPSSDVILEGLIELDDFLNANGIDYILTGSLGLFVHGISPASYKPHDIDIIVLNNCYNIPNDCLLSLFEQYYGKTSPIYEGGRRMFVFNIGTSHIEINAFVHDDALFPPINYKAIHISNHIIKVHNVIGILEEKYKLHRLKDYRYNVAIQSMLNELLN